ncbi:MAG: tRNA guanosine(34) transglycosylase Tgt [Thermodesulfobacteriota bacterium]
MFKFEVLKTDPGTGARTGRIQTPHGAIDTPCFMPVATQATVKAMTPRALEEIGAQVLIVNAYHMYLRPGVQRVRELGGLHEFMGWSGPLVTDSGGFQALSLAKVSEVAKDGIMFQSHLDGTKYKLTPEGSIDIQEALGADIMMCLDECPPFPSTREYMEKSARLTVSWARRCREVRVSRDKALFGIVQGGVYEDLREESARDLEGMGFDGYAIGGLGIGESKEQRLRATGTAVQYLPDGKPRYLMGVGLPEDIARAAALGMDMFDCVIPTRNARNGTLFTNHGKVVIKNARYADDSGPVDEDCGCYTCSAFSKAYLRHLYLAGEILASILMTMHNLYFYSQLMTGIRESIFRGDFSGFKSMTGASGA